MLVATVATICLGSHWAAGCGCVWACSNEGREVWRRNLGPADKVAEVMSQWLANYDDGERI